MRTEFTNKVGMICKIYLSDEPREIHYTYAKIKDVKTLEETYNIRYGTRKYKLNRQEIKLEFIESNKSLREVDKCIYKYHNMDAAAHVRYIFENQPIKIIRK